MKVPGGILLIPFRLISKICSDFKLIKSDASTFYTQRKIKLKKNNWKQWGRKFSYLDHVRRNIQDFQVFHFP